MKFYCGCVSRDCTEDGKCIIHDRSRIFLSPHVTQSGFVTAFRKDSESGFHFTLHSCTYDEHGFIATISRNPLTETFRIPDADSEKIYHEAVKKVIGEEKFLIWKQDICTSINVMTPEMFY